ncbi:MAG: hypothetical protein LBS26_05540 [Campylobacteraceae bacterium]|jgi:hypothetical protein|nr:hypothetical protein [Campylobacteraceae bacterium]
MTGLTTNSGALALFKFKAFSLSLSLLVAFFLSFFLIGCGGGGSSSGDGDDTGGSDTNLSLALIESSFPAFNDSEYSLSCVESNKEYEVQAAQIADFNSSVLQSQSYTQYGNGHYEKTGVLPNINASVHLDESIDLYLYGSDFAKLTKDETFNTVFGEIDGDVSYVFIYKEYSSDISSKFDAYAASALSPLGFNCSKPAGADWTCVKEDNGITYQWLVGDNYSYYYDIYFE